MSSRMKREEAKKLAGLAPKEIEEIQRREQEERDAAVQRSAKALINWQNRRTVASHQVAGSPYQILCLDDDLYLMSGVYFLNTSSEVLEEVTYVLGGFQTVDDTVMSVHSREARSYKRVAPGEAVRFDLYDEIYDLDVVLQYQFTVSMPDGHAIELISEPTKRKPGGLLKVP